MKDVHIEINEVLLEFRNCFWEEVQRVLHEQTTPLIGREIACLALQRTAQWFRVNTPEEHRGEPHD